MIHLFRYSWSLSVAVVLAAGPAWGTTGSGGQRDWFGGRDRWRRRWRYDAWDGGRAADVAGRQSVFSSLNASQNAALSSQLTPLLAASSSMTAAAAGFHDDREFITAAHAAHNLNIPFDRVKAETTGRKSMSLDAAVRKLRPDLDSKAAKESVSLAQKQTARDIARASAAGTKDKVASRVRRIAS